MQIKLKKQLDVKFTCWENNYAKKKKEKFQQW